MMKLDTCALGRELKGLGFEFFSGVPCSFLNPLINFAINEATFVMNTNEGDAVATCAGAFLAGKKSVVLMQNSGLTNATSPLTSLTYCFRIPILGFISLRGEQGIHDEPQHELMGRITEKMLDLMEIPWEYLSSDINEVKRQISRADDFLRSSQTYFFIVKKNTLEEVDLKHRTHLSSSNLDLSEKGSSRPPLFTRSQFLNRIVRASSSDAVLLATTGRTGRELFEIEDSYRNLYMVGSMGCISSLALGIALNSRKPVIAIDGDGALLMRLGNMATLGLYSPRNLLHILIDNGVHDSTGGQATAAPNINFVRIAASCGYTRSIFVDSLESLVENIQIWQDEPALTFFHILIKPGSRKDLGRPNIGPKEVRDRIMAFLNEK